ncbi:choice-of-anchor U domain-containing protein [Diaphorobacter caeni]|uniref:choice-of-anchor U domain-containing protein n=1 Tax=Diaphorobacter caeni TaxID=2784387 RepID=UPI00188DC9C1|nr:choice-of-anchor U domain-containing protein [Diaphorobacter caeni]MBF5002676.1 fibronectin type III domain-containing protein [Diaphorobacter caeni]
MKCLQNLGAGLLLSAAALNTGYATELLANGGFETNGGVGTASFPGWQTFAQGGSVGGFLAQQGTKSAATPVTVAAPPQGSFAAMSDQPGPGSHVIYQDVAIPAGYPAALSAQVYVQSASSLAAAPASLDYTQAAPNQQARIDVMKPAAALDDVGAGVLANVFQWPAAGATPTHQVQAGGYQTVTLDLSAYAGQTIRLRIAEVDNRQSLFFGVDAVSINSGAPAAQLGAPTILSYFVQGTSVALTFTPVASVPMQTVTGYAAQCTPQGGGAALTGSAAASPVTVAGLTAAAAYNCTVAATTASTTGPASNSVSFAVPITGSNGAVVSVPTAGGAGLGSAAIALSGAGGSATSCVLQPVSGFVPATSAPVPPPQGAAAFPFGLLNVSASGCVPGATAQLTVTLAQAIPAGAQYWKYGPTPSNSAPHWYAFAGFSASGSSYTLTLIDGAEGDDDLSANGVIADPGGVMVTPGSSAGGIPVPVWDLWALLGAGLMLSLAAMRRRHPLRR